MISYNLAGKTALVTGGASGIGFATAKMLAGFGATVAVNFLVDDPRGPEAVDQINAEGGKAIMAPGSVGEAGVAERMVLKAIDDLGRLDMLFNNAGTPGTRHRIAPPQRGSVRWMRAQTSATSTGPDVSTEMHDVRPSGDACAAQPSGWQPARRITPQVVRRSAP